jgi:8-oxo-dGTP pyrophosphatase MutT (NUDIX family)
MPINLCYQNTSGVLLLDKSKTRCLIVHQRNSDLWSLPKGHAQGSENIIETGFRELFEETGIYLPNHKYQFYGKLNISQDEHSGCVSVCCIKEDYLSMDISNCKDTDEIDCVKWVNVDDLICKSSPIN